MLSVVGVENSGRSKSTSPNIKTTVMAKPMHVKILQEWVDKELDKHLGKMDRLYLAIANKYEAYLKDKKPDQVGLMSPPGRDTLNKWHKFRFKYMPSINHLEAIAAYRDKNETAQDIMDWLNGLKADATKDIPPITEEQVKALSWNESINVLGMVAKHMDDLRIIDATEEGHR